MQLTSRVDDDEQYPAALDRRSVGCYLCSISGVRRAVPTVVPGPQVSSSQGLLLILLLRHDFQGIGWEPCSWNYLFGTSSYSVHFEYSLRAPGRGRYKAGSCAANALATHAGDLNGLL